MASARMKELLKKYGKVGLGVHFSVSAASVAGLYAAIKNNVDVESLFHKFGLSNVTGNKKDPIDTTTTTNTPSDDVVISDYHREDGMKKERNRTAELASSSGGALALAVLCNKALFPIRVPITLVLTPPVARFLARRQIVKSGVV